MKRVILSLTLISFVLAGCGAVRESRLNPFNWFGRSEPVQTQTEEEKNPLIPDRSRPLISFLGAGNADLPDTTTPITSVTELVVERVPGGAIVRATGLDPVQGAFNVNLAPLDDNEQPDENGILNYELKRDRQIVRSGPGPVQTREVTAARFVSDQKLAGVRTIRVLAETNARQVRRR